MSRGAGRKERGRELAQRRTNERTDGTARTAFAGRSEASYQRTPRVVSRQSAEQSRATVRWLLSRCLPFGHASSCGRPGHSRSTHRRTSRCCEPCANANATPSATTRKNRVPRRLSARQPAPIIASGRSELRSSSVVALDDPHSSYELGRADTSARISLSRGETGETEPMTDSA